MKRIYILSVFLIPLFTVSAQMRKNANYERYIETYKDIAIEQMKKYKVPASITLAQGLFESGAGMSSLARNSNNHFGIKCHRWRGATVYHDDDERGECFRAYNNPRDSYEDHSKFLVTSSRYRSLFDLKITDYKGWSRGLKKAGYATNPRYADKLIEIIELYDLNRFDKAKKYDKYKANYISNHHNSQLPYVIYAYNSNYYLRARQGDTFHSLAKETGVSASKLAKYNERDKDEILSQGDIIYLKKKQKRATKEFSNKPHFVKPGESMYLICQLYGIRLESLYKMNNLHPDYQIQVGDCLRVR